MTERPEMLIGFTTKLQTGHGNVYVTVNEIDDKPFEVFCSIGKSGEGIMAKAEVTGRLVSLALRNGIPVERIIRQIKDIYGFEPKMNGDRLVKSIPDAVAYVLETRYCKKEMKC